MSNSTLIKFQPWPIAYARCIVFAGAKRSATAVIGHFHRLHVAKYPLRSSAVHFLSHVYKDSTLMCFLSPENGAVGLLSWLVEVTLDPDVVVTIPARSLDLISLPLQTSSPVLRINALQIASGLRSTPLPPPHPFRQRMQWKCELCMQAFG